MSIAISRELKGKAIAQVDGQITRLGPTDCRVKSQSGNGFYLVHFSTLEGWKCSCPDHVYREVKCKHIWACELSFRIREKVKAENVSIQLITTLACVACGSESIVKDALRRNRYGSIQRYLCKACGKRFSYNLGFEKMKAQPQAITSAIQLYFTGESLRNVQKFLRLQGVNVSHVAIYKWITKYTALMAKYLDKITPQVSDVWRADELYLKVKGNMKYLYALMDDETRFWIAQEVADTKNTADVRPLFQLGKEIAGKSPKTLITDGAQNFHDAFNKELRTTRYGSPKHIQDIRFDGKIHNNKMERMNGEIRDREKVMRSLKNPDTPIIAGLQIYHNYVRPHMALGGRTPAEAAGIQVRGKNKWLTLIQNASQG